LRCRERLAAMKAAKSFRSFRHKFRHGRNCGWISDLCRGRSGRVGIAVAEAPSLRSDSGVISSLFSSLGRSRSAYLRRMQMQSSRESTDYMSFIRLLYVYDLGRPVSGTRRGWDLDRLTQCQGAHRWLRPGSAGLWPGSLTSTVTQIGIPHLPVPSLYARCASIGAHRAPVAHRVS
jgi:hypothetical protein